LRHNARDLRDERKARLEKLILAGNAGWLHYSESFDDGIELLNAVDRLGLQGGWKRLRPQIKTAASRSSDEVLTSSRFVVLPVSLRDLQPTNAGPPVHHSITSSARTNDGSRYGDTKCRGSVEIDDKLEFRCPLDRQIAGLGALENFVHKGGRLAILFEVVHPIADQAAGFREVLAAASWKLVLFCKNRNRLKIVGKHRVRVVNHSGVNTRSTIVEKAFSNSFGKRTSYGRTSTLSGLAAISITLNIDL
jgi:hypothetical protein